MISNILISLRVYLSNTPSVAGAITGHYVTLSDSGVVQSVNAIHKKTNGTTPVEIVPITASGSVNALKNLSVVNNDTSNIVVTVEQFNETNASSRLPLAIVELTAGQTLVIDSNGTISTVGGAQNMSGVEYTSNKDVANGYAGLTGLKINFKNVANTFTSFFTNSNTAPRTYDYQDKDYTVAGLTDIKCTCDFRLTLTSGTPITTADVTAATTIYCTPYNGNSIALYDGTKWNVRQSAEFSIALGTLTNDQGYDVFCYDNAGVPTLELLAWTNNTTRAAVLVYQDGIYVKSGAATRRYLGSFLTTSTTTTESSATKRCLYNYYNQTESTLKKYDASNYLYTAAARRQANGSTANQVLVFKGLDDKPVNLLASFSYVSTSSATALSVCVSIGLDSTTTVAGDCLASFLGLTSTSSGFMSCVFNGYVGLGKHILVWQQTGNTDVTFQGTTGGVVSSGLLGSTAC